MLSTEIPCKLAYATTDGGYRRDHAYDTTGRPSTVTLTIDGTAYGYTTTYDATTGQITKVTYPSGFVAKYTYNGRGYVIDLRQDGASTFY